jgi:hypothetical protein
MVFVWRDCAMTIEFPSGRRMYAHPRRGQSLDSIIYELAGEAISRYCQSVGIVGAEIRVHNVPPKASTREQIFAWSSLFQAFQSQFSHPRASTSAGPFRQPAEPTDAENPSCQMTACPGKPDVVS